MARHLLKSSVSSVMTANNIENVRKPVASLYPDDVGLRCVNVVIPDYDGYLWLLAGFVALLGNDWSWIGTKSDRYKRAYLWQQAYAETDWEQCVNCEDVADCIENDEGVQNALKQNLINNINNSGDVQYALQQVYNQWIGGQPMPPSVSGQNLLPENLDCDLDKLFGSIFYAIDEMNQNNIDAFEATEVIGNALERANLLMSAIPVFETLPIDEVLEYAETLWTEDLFEAYIANDTTTYRDLVKCDLFCIARDNGCYLSIDDMFQYFVSRIGADPQNDLAQLIAYLITGTWVGTQVNDMFFASQLIVLKYGNQFFNFIGVKNYATLLAIGARTPNDTWMLICDDCPVLCEEFDFRTSDYFPQWRIRPNVTDEPMSLYIPSVGYIPREQSVGGFQNQIYVFGVFECDNLEYVYICPNVPTQVQLFWCNADFTVLELASNLDAASGTVTGNVDLSILTPPSGATGLLLVSGSATDIDDVVLWQQANFS